MRDITIHLYTLTNILLAQHLQNATVDLSKKGVPTICKVLPIYKTIEVHLVSAKVEANLHPDATFPLEDALQAGLKKLRTYISKALKSDYPLLGTSTFS